MMRPGLEREESKILEITEKFKEERKINRIPFAHKIKHFHSFLKS